MGDADIQYDFSLDDKRTLMRAVTGVASLVLKALKIQPTIIF